MSTKSQCVTLFGFLWMFISVKMCEGDLKRPRGVSISMAPLYQYKSADPSFHCLDKSHKIPFEYVNDDYCDCPDGSDEPGTSACPNGKYHCTNAGHSPQNILSSRVNDGICDCCDGSDEYQQIIQCTNNCKELGKLAREEAEQEKKLLAEGFQTKIKYCDEGKKAVEEKQANVVELEQKLEEAKADAQAAGVKKTDAEIPEREAKEAQDKIWQEEKEQREKEADALKCSEAFREMDINADGLLDIMEISLHPEFDIDNNTIVSEEEAKEYMGDATQADMVHFVDKMWTGIKDIYKPLFVNAPDPVPEGQQPPEPTEQADTQQLEPTPPTPEHKEPDEEQHETQTPEPYDDEEDFRDDSSDDQDDRRDDDDDEDVNDRAEDSDEDDYNSPEVTPATPKSEKGDNNSDEEQPQYDDATKELIKNADEARANFKAADDEVKRIEKEISDLKSFLELDLGPEKEFYPLKGQCYELDDKEYTYILCPYDRATQKSKNGGGDTSLGKWGKWTGPENDKYSSMIYENGQNCWNGPDRSVTVTLKCGLENKLTSASEPSRCEYHFSFISPAVCTKQPDVPVTHTHTEL